MDPINSCTVNPSQNPTGVVASAAPPVATQVATALLNQASADAKSADTKPLTPRVVPLPQQTGGSAGLPAIDAETSLMTLTQKLLEQCEQIADQKNKSVGEDQKLATEIIHLAEMLGNQEATKQKNLGDVISSIRDATRESLTNQMSSLIGRVGYHFVGKNKNFIHSFRVLFEGFITVRLNERFLNLTACLCQRNKCPYNDELNLKATLIALRMLKLRFALKRVEDCLSESIKRCVGNLMRLWQEQIGEGNVYEPSHELPKGHDHVKPFNEHVEYPDEWIDKWTYVPPSKKPSIFW